jgi:fumarate reductase flavoprotein subunit
VVIGAGNAGMTAAVELAKAGFKIILVEKQGLLGGGDSMLQSTSTNAGGSRMINQLGVQNASTEDFYNWLQNTADTKGINIDRDSTRTYAMRSGEIIDWLMDLGVDYGRFGKDNFSHYIRDGSAPGINIMPAIGAEIKRLNVDYRLNTRAERILMDNGKAVGVEVTGPDGKYTITARAVMIATGGYSNNQDLVAKYCPQWSNRPTTGARSLTGDGIFMAEAAGAAIYNMDVVKANYLCHVIASGDGVSLTALTPYVILVNR